MTQEWISVKERLPESTDTVLVVIELGEHTMTDVAYHMKEEEYTGWVEINTDNPLKWKVTHWQRFPKPPKK